MIGDGSVEDSSSIPSILQSLITLQSVI